MGVRRFTFHTSVGAVSGPEDRVSVIGPGQPPGVGDRRLQHRRGVHGTAGRADERRERGHSHSLDPPRRRAQLDVVAERLGEQHAVTQSGAAVRAGPARGAQSPHRGNRVDEIERRRDRHPGMEQLRAGARPAMGRPRGDAHPCARPVHLGLIVEHDGQLPREHDERLRLIGVAVAGADTAATGGDDLGHHAGGGGLQQHGPLVGHRVAKDGSSRMLLRALSGTAYHHRAAFAIERAAFTASRPP
jgi:hypothetical protein